MKLIVVQVRVRVKCIVDSYPDLISTTFAIVPADLQSAGNEYQDLFNPITSYLTSPYIFNAKLSLDFSLLTS